MTNLKWSQFKSFVDVSKYPIFYAETDDSYELDCKEYHCQIPKDSGADQTDFETNYKALSNKPVINEVTTQYEKNDKTLRCMCAFADTDSNGEAEFSIPIPASGRWIAYGDVEFESRAFGDYVKLIELTDLDRVLAMMVALQIDPGATEPVDDATAAAALGLPLYPVLGHYDERGLPDPLPVNAKGNPKGGIAMTFQYGITEAQPIGGYGKLEGLMYLRIVAKKSTAVSGIKCQLSIDWAENNG